MSMTEDDTNRLKHIVERYAELATEVDGYKDDAKQCADEQKDLAAVASERLGLDGKALKQLVAEFRMGAEERDVIRQREAKLDECRLALGLLADTPLGQAAMADEPKRNRGRPKGSKNRPKVEDEPLNAPVDPAGDPPQIPDSPWN
jgi:hypothetical protein